MKIRVILPLALSAVCAAGMLTACKISSSGSSSSSKIQTTAAEITTETEAVVKYTLPKLLGRTEQEIKSELAGVRVAVMHAYDEDYPAGQVFKANVKEGDTIYSGQDMTIYISLGHNYGNDVIGMSGDEAKNYLESHGVQIGYISDGDPTEDPALVGKVYDCSFLGEKALLNVYADGVPEETSGEEASGEETSELTGEDTGEQLQEQTAQPESISAE